MGRSSEISLALSARNARITAAAYDAGVVDPGEVAGAGEDGDLGVGEQARPAPRRRARWATGRARRAGSAPGRPAWRGPRGCAPGRRRRRGTTRSPRRCAAARRMPRARGRVVPAAVEQRLALQLLLGRRVLGLEGGPHVVVPRLAGAAFERGLPLGVVGVEPDGARARRDQDQPGDQVGPALGQQQGDVRAGRVSEHVERRHAQVVDERRDVGGDAVGAVAVGVRVGLEAPVPRRSGTTSLRSSRGPGSRGRRGTPRRGPARPGSPAAAARRRAPGRRARRRSYDR